MPVITVYLKERTYFVIASEAEKMGVGIGKFVSMLADDYVNYLEKKRISANNKGDVR